MNEEAILELYNELSTDYEVGDIDQFKAYLQDPESRVDFFEQIIKPIYAVENIADFEAFYGLKKKDDTAFGLEDGSSELTPLSRNQQLGVTPAVEKDTAIERMFGKNEVTDFFGDLYRSGVQGYAQGATVDDALNLFAKGQDISDEDLKEYIESVRKMESFGPSEEMQDFTKIYEKNGKGVWGFISGVAQNPTVIPQLFTSSVSAMLNKGSIAAGAAGAATGGIGAGLATGGLAAIPGALIGGIGGVSGALETGLSYTEFLKEELDKEGLSFDEDNVKKILLNEEAMNSIKNKALARGLTIAAIDAFSGGLATSVTRKTATKLGSKLAGATAGGTVEALGGATGEAAARLVTGQEMDIAEIGFEGVAGTATAPLTVGAGLMKPPSYSMNGGKASRKDIQKLLSTGTPEQIAAVKISVKNDSDLYKEAQTKKSDIILLAEIEAANPGIIEEDKSKLLVLEKARQTLANSSLKSAKNNLTLIDEKIDAISKKYSATEAEIITTEEEVRTSLENKGITDPTPQQLVEESDLLTQKKIKDAVQESSTETPPVSDQPGVGEEVGKRDTAGEITGEVAPQEETIPPTDQETQKKTLDDGQVVKSAEVFDVDMDGDNITVEVKTNLDGSREVIITTKAGVAKERLSKDNPMSNADYVTKAYGTIKDSKTKPITEVMSQKKIDRLSSEQKKAIGLEVETTEADVTEVEIIYNLPKDPNEAVADFEILDNRNEKEGLEIYEDGSGKWYVRNKITGKIADAKSKKEAQELINNPDWDYGEGDIVQQVETAKEEKPTGFITKPSIEKPFIVPTKKNRPSNTQINFTEDGKIDSVVNKKTGKPVSTKTRKVAEKLYLESLIDVNDGKFTEYQEGVTEERANQFVAENSQNVREIAEAIESEKNSIVNQRLEFDEADVLYDIDGYFTIEDIAEVWDERLINENSKSGRNIRRYWTRPALDKFGRPTLGISKIDTTAEELGISVEALKEIIIDYPTRNINRPEEFSRAVAKVGKTDALIDLENKFEKLTGLKATDTNINTVLDIDPNRPPLTEEKKLSLIEREQAIVESEGERVIKGKKVSAEQVVGGKPKEVTVEEIKALKDQIRLEARAAREAKLDIKKKRAQINEVIKGIKSKAQITTTQAGVLTRKINTLNVDNETKVEEFLKYAEKIVRNAELAEKIKRADGLRKTAKKNIKNKIGTAKDLFPALESLFNINIQAIPLNKIDSYLELAEAFGERKSVLTLPEKSLALQQAEDILNSIEDEAQITDDTKVKEDDYNLQEEIDNIVNNRIEVPTLIEPEKVIADYLNSLSKEDIEGLVTEKDGKKNYSQVEKLKNVLANIENGYVPKAASELQVYGKANRSSNKISPVIGKLKFNVLEQGLEKAIAKVKAGLNSRKRDVIGKQIGAVPLTNIDEALGNFNKKDIARETFDYLASEYSKYEVALGKIDNILSEAEALLTQGKRGRFSKRLLNQSIKAKYKIMAYQLQREYESNSGKKGTAPALDFINATVDAIKSEEQNFLKDNDVKILEEIKKEFIADGKIDNDKILNSLSPREKKALELIDQANQSLAEKALFTSAVLRGNRVNLFSNYVHHDVIMKNQEDVENMLDDKRKRMTKPSTKSKTLLERTPGAKPISFDPISSAGRAAKETLLDFHMTQPIRIVNKTLSNVIETIESDPNSTKLQRGTAKAVKDAFEEINSIIFDNTYQEIGVADKFLDKAKKLGYYAALASLPRAGAELGSNLSFALASNPQGLADGIKNYGKYSMGAEGAEVLNAIGSSQTLKLYNKESLTGKLADTNLYQRGKDKRGKAVNPVSEAINYLYNNLPIIKGPIEATRVISENLISTPDKAISRPLYFDTFVRSFAEATKKSGKEIKLTSKDFKNIDDYVAKYPDEIKEAREKADDENIRMATTVNPYSSILKLQPKKGDGTINKIYKQANGYMARFTLFEYSTFRKAVRALYTDGEISKSQAAGLIAGSVARMTSYMILYQFLSNMFDTVMGGLFGLDVEEEEDELENQLMRQLVGTGSTLILKRSFGNVPAIGISLGIELLNEKYGEDLRSGEEYDEFENSLVFSQIGLNEFRKAPLEILLTKTFLGPYTPLARSLSRGVKVAQRLTGSAKEETKQKYMDELTGRMAIEAAGNLGLFPFYKDARRILLKHMFKDTPKTSGKGSKYTEKDFKNAKGNPAKQKYIRERINAQKNTSKKFTKRSIPGTKK